MTQAIDRLLGAAALAFSVIWSQGPAVADWLEIAAAMLPGQIETEAPRPPAKPWAAR